MKAYSILTPDYDHQYVGRFGDSGPSNISHWIRILQETTTEVQVQSKHISISVDLTN